MCSEQTRLSRFVIRKEPVCKQLICLCVYRGSWVNDRERDSDSALLHNWQCIMSVQMDLIITKTAGFILTWDQIHSGLQKFSYPLKCSTLWHITATHFNYGLSGFCLTYQHKSKKYGSEAEIHCSGGRVFDKTVIIYALQFAEDLAKM